MFQRFRFALLAVVLAIVFSASVVTAADLTQSISRFVRINTDHITVNRTATVTGATALASTLTVAGNAAFSGDVAFVPQAAVTVTNGSEINPTTAYIPLTSAGTVGTSSILTATSTVGDLIVLVNTANTTITISDTGALRLSGNIALGQFDTLTLLFDGTAWNQLATSNN